MLGRPEGNHEEAAAPTSSIPRRLTRSLYGKSRPHVSGVPSQCSCTSACRRTAPRGAATPVLSGYQQIVECRTRPLGFMRIRINPNRRGSECVSRTPDVFAATVQHVSTDHRRHHVFVTQQFLNRTDVIAILQQIGLWNPIGSRTPSHSLPSDPSNRVGASSSAPNKKTKLSTTN
jgi:hypothetical protein